MEMTPKDTARIRALIAQHAELIQATNRKLACDFGVPANRTINDACSHMGISRTDWEKIVCVQNGREFKPIPKRILERWEAE
jgi:hypothetical protein